MDVMNFLVSSVIITALGCIFHFTYDWSGKKKWVGIFSAVNESTWEHIKIGLTGALLYAIVDGIMVGGNGNFLIGKAAELLIIIFAMPTMYYIIDAILRRLVLVVDILEFVATIFLSRLVFYQFLAMPKVGGIWEIVAGVAIGIVVLCYVTFTFFPPKNFLFVDTRNGKYGFSASQTRARKRKKRRK